VRFRIHLWQVLCKGLPTPHVSRTRKSRTGSHTVGAWNGEPRAKADNLRIGLQAILEPSRISNENLHFWRPYSRQDPIADSPKMLLARVFELNEQSYLSGKPTFNMSTTCPPLLMCQMCQTYNGIFGRVYHVVNSSECASKYFESHSKSNHIHTWSFWELVENWWRHNFGVLDLWWAYHLITFFDCLDHFFNKDPVCDAWRSVCDLSVLEKDTSRSFKKDPSRSFKKDPSGKILCAILQDLVCDPSKKVSHRFTLAGSADLVPRVVGHFQI